ncbi:MAG TPA: beta-ketoacyl synthase N-terminal-like domain-containing protein [Pyrinomonadaceae bacterium]|nr:beta-ketoacyl synthase N-terminal-like domain-containing protein [Pyrinomonadaceae bacterium]
MANTVSRDSLNGIAIIGLAGRFPGARNVEEFWANLRGGVESISFFTDEELLKAGVSQTQLSDPRYVKAKGSIEGAEMFDAWLFGFSPREAEIMDPQHRLFMECAWEALESAGYNSERYGGAIGVFAGGSMNSYFLENLLSNPQLLASIGVFQAIIGNDKDFLPTQVSYKLNLKGPSVNVQTSCSTSLVAVHLACQSLLNYQCDMALAGGVSVTLPMKTGFYYQEGGVVSPDGHCRTFDAEAKGTVSGNGVGLVVLKRLEEAVHDGDEIEAVILGSAINNDGAAKVAYTAPSVEGQSAVIVEAQAMAGVTADSISYVEAHGTATPLGDPIEVAALTRAFRASTKQRGYCAVGSVKSNIGHLDAAAGVAGLIKTVLSLKYGELPPSLHFERANPEIDFASSPFYVNGSLQRWERNGGPRRAGVSSFGIGGTNAHVIVEEAPAPEPGSRSGREWQVLAMSAKTESALEQATANLGAHLEKEQVALADLGYTLAVGRRVFGHRRVVLCREREQALAALSGADGPQRLSGVAREQRPSVVLLYPGQGAQRVNMGRTLYESEAVYRETVDRCAGVLERELGVDLRAVLYGAESRREQLQQTEWAQPALFVTEYALTEQLRAWGVEPEGLLGHSVGEWVAATVAGVFKWEDALRLVALRGRLMQQRELGVMLSVALSESEMEERIARQREELGRVEVSAVNGAAQIVVGGRRETIERWAEQLHSEGVWTKHLETSHAYHTWMMEEAMAEFEGAVAKVEKRAPQVNMISGVSGEWLRAEEAQSAGYWGRQMRERVRFAAGVLEVLSESGRVVVEVGPGNALSGLVRQQAQGNGAAPLVVSLLGGKGVEHEYEQVLRGVAQLWLEGVGVKWEELWRGERRQRVKLPTYPFERVRCWVDVNKVSRALPVHTGKQPDIANWFYAPSWKRSTLARLERTGEPKNGKLCWLVFTSKNEFGSEVVKHLQQQGEEVISVLCGTRFTKLEDRIYKIDPQQRQDYSALVKELGTLARPPQCVIHLWSLNTIPKTHDLAENFEKAQAQGFHSLLFLAQALDEYKVKHNLDLTVVSDSVQEVTGDELLQPEKATVLGPSRIFAQEYPQITYRSIDVVLPKSKPAQHKLIKQLIPEITAKPEDTFVAYRGQHRWTQSFEPLRIPVPKDVESHLSEGALYLITGGLSAINFDLAEFLTHEVRAKLLIVGRNEFPLREQWEQWLLDHDEDDEVSLSIQRLRQLEALGTEVLPAHLDPEDTAQLRSAVSAAQERFGPLKGIFYNSATNTRSTPIRDISAAECGSYLRQTRAELAALESLIKETELDFCLVLSSLSTVVGGRGSLASATANYMLDAFAQKQKQKAPGSWIILNLDTPRFGTKDGPGADDLAIKTAEAREVLRRVLSWHTASQLAVSTIELSTRIELEKDAEAKKEASDTSVDKKASITSYSRPNLSTTYVGPRNEVERTIARMYEELLGILPIGINDDFFELGGHSLVGIQLTFRIRETYDLEDFHMNTLFEKPTPAGLAEAVEEIRRTGLTMPPILVPIQPKGSNPPFFCIHPIGGGVYGLVDLGRQMLPDQPFYAVQAMGLAHYGESEDHQTLEQMAAEYIEAIRFISPQGPYFLGGLSFGGIVAFEMAQQLKRHGEEVALLALLDTPAPQTIAKVAALDDAILLLGLTRERGRQKGLELNVSTKDLERLPPEERLMFLMKTLKESGLAPEDLDDRWLRNFMRGYRARINTTVNYEPQVYPGRITLFRAIERDAEMEEHLKSVGQHEYTESCFGWDKVSFESIEVIPTQGHHEVIAVGDDGIALSEQLKACIDRNWKAFIKSKSVGT